MALRKIPNLPVITNAKGEPIKLTAQEQHLANHLQREINRKFENSLAYEIPITTLTTIMKKITEQKFFEVAPADYLPVRVGEGRWSAQLTTYRSFDLADEFETGIINTGGQNARLAVASAGVDALTIRVLPWAKEIGWTVFEIEQAALAGNWDLVTALERSRKKNWDLGIQRTAFLGARGLNGTNGTVLGLLNQVGITINTSVITKSIKSMTPDELSVFCAQVYEAYRENCQRTAVPTHFILPESDYNGLASQAAPAFPIKSKLQVLRETFAEITQRRDFKILPLSYADAQYHEDVQGIVGKQVYTLLNYEEESLRMDIPIDYTNTLANSVNNFQFQNTGYGQFTGVLAYRPLEMIYFQYDV